MNAEAYVLFYRKNNSDNEPFKERLHSILGENRDMPSLMTYYVSKQWLNKMETFAEPGKYVRVKNQQQEESIPTSKTPNVNDDLFFCQKNITIIYCYLQDRSITPTSCADMAVSSHSRPSTFMTCVSDSLVLLGTIYTPRLEVARPALDCTSAPSADPNWMH